MRDSLKLAGLFGLALFAMQFAPLAFADEPFPTRIIHIVAPSTPGGPTDVIARMLAERLAPVFKVPVIVENRPGATGSIGLNAVAKAPPDGYTLLVGYISANVIYPLLNPNLPFDARKDFTPITQVFSGAGILVVHPSVPANNLQEFIAYAKAQTKPLLYGSFGTGSTSHLSAEYLQILTGIKMVHVPYKTTMALMNDLLGGHVVAGFLDSTNSFAQIRSNRLKGIAQAGSTRSPSLPNVPTMIEQGVPFTIGGAWNGVFGPANMPLAVVERLNQEIVGILRQPEVRDYMIKAVGHPPTPMTSAAFSQIVQNDFETFKKIIDRAGITLE